MSKKDPNAAIHLLGNIQSSVRRNTIVSTVALIVAGLTVCASVFFSLDFVSRERENVFVLDQGSVLTAFKADGMAQRDHEIVDHMKTFHSLFYRVAPDADLFQENMTKALELADESAYAFYNDLLEKQYYDKLLAINAVQDIRVDSVNFNLNEYPYPVTTYCSLFVYRESNISTYNYQTTCELIAVPRSMNNPHGLLIQKFREEKFELVGTRKRRKL